MVNYSITEVFEKLLSSKDFRNNYFLAYLDRFVYTATELEHGLSPEERKKAISSLLEAFTYLMTLESPKLSPTDIAVVGDSVNRDSGYEGFRKVMVSAGKFADWTPVAPRSIYYSIYSLLNNYYNVWVDRNVYEKEAAFHIMLMRIHPFEDGNKRTAKLLMNANFVKQNYPPVIITEGDTIQYYNFINNEDVEGFAKFLKERSLQELNTIISYYKVANNIPITESVIEAMNLKDGGRK